MNAQLVLASFAAVVLMSSCGEDSPSDPPQPIGAIPYAASTGDVYRWSVTQRDSAGSDTVVAADTFRVRVLATNETAGAYTDLVCLEGSPVTHPESGATKVWYSMTRDSMVEVAYSGAGRMPMILPKTGKPVLTAGTPFSMTSVLRQYVRLSVGPIDTTILRDEPRVVYVFPMSSGKSWTSFASPILEQRTVGEYQFVKVPAGLFRVADVRTTLDFDTTLVWHDYVGPGGLVKRTISVTLLMTDARHPDGPGEILRMDETLELLSRE